MLPTVRQLRRYTKQGTERGRGDRDRSWAAQPPGLAEAAGKGVRS